MKGTTKPFSLAAIIGLALLVWGGEYLARDFWEPDEARYVYVAREMQANGHWLVPHRHGVYYAHKPPLMFWLQNGFSALAGGHAPRVTARLPSLTGAILSLWAITRLAWLWGHAGASRRVPFILCTSFLFWNVCGMGQIDALLCGLQMAGLYLLFRADAEETNGKATGLRFLAYLAMGLAVIAKGPVGYVIPMGVYVAVRLVFPNRRSILKPHLLWGLLVAALPCALWILAVWLSDPPEGYLPELIFDQNAGRVTGTKIRGHHRPFYYFLWHFPLEFLPWTLFLAAGLPRLLKTADWRTTGRRLAAWIGAVLLIFSLSVTKRNLYILVAYPAAALLTAMAWDELVRGNTRPGRALGFAISILFAVAAAALFGAAFYPALPIPGKVLWAPAAVLFTGAMLLWVLLKREGLTNRWFYAFASVLIVSQVLVGTCVYGALNPLKCPYELAEAAKTYLPPGEPLMLYRMYGETMALFCNARGLHYETRAQIFGAMRKHRKGIVVVEERQWKSIQDHGSLRGRQRPFRMGSKRLLYIPYDMDE